MKIHIFSIKKLHLNMFSGKKAAILSRPQCVKFEPDYKSIFKAKFTNDLEYMYVGQLPWVTMLGQASVFQLIGTWEMGAVMFPSSYHHENFSGDITIDQSEVHAKGQGQRSKVKVTEVKSKLNRFRTVTPVWIHIWWWNDAQSLMLLRRGVLLVFKVICQILRSHCSKNHLFLPKLGVSGL